MHRVCYGLKKHNKAIISMKDRNESRNTRTQGKDGKKTGNDTQIDETHERSRRKNIIITE